MVLSRRSFWSVGLVFLHLSLLSEAKWFCWGSSSTSSSSETPSSAPSSRPVESSVPSPTTTTTATESPPTTTTTPAPTTTTTTPSPSSPTSAPTTIITTTTKDEEDDELYTIIVVADLENKYRGHNLERSRFVVQYIRDLKHLDLYFDGEYRQSKIDPQLVINNGDVSHFWSCHNPNYLSFIFGGCRSPDEEFLDIWGQLYDANIPMISAYGNHDWRPKIGTGNPVRGTPRQPRDEEADIINMWSSEFTYKTYEKAAAAGGIEFEEIPPTGYIGQSMFRSTFRGLQMASFNAAYNWQSYDDNGVYNADDQFARLAATLNRTQPTLFFSHFPLSATRLKNQTPTPAEVVSLIREFPPGVHHFAGHYHAAIVEQYDGFNDYIAPYPHTWGAGRLEPGYLAVLVSRQRGILQVKPMTIPGLEDGTVCVPTNTVVGNSYLQEVYRKVQKRLGNWIGLRGRLAPEDNNNGCDRCKAGKQHWSTLVLGWVCGDESSGGNSQAQPDGQENSDSGVLFDSLDEAELEE